MAHYKALFDSKYLGAWDFVHPETGQKREATWTIEKVEAGKIVGENGKTDKKPLVYFKGRELPMICNKTNAKAIAGMYGNDTREWVGKPVRLYVATVAKPGGSGEMCDAIRVRPTIPQAPKGDSDAAAQ